MVAVGRDLRLMALRRFAIAITVLNVLGHTVLGFEQSWAQPLVALATAYSVELLLEVIEARAHGRPARFRTRQTSLVDFLLPAHITGLAVNMLLYSNERLLPVVFAAAVAVGSKAIFRAPTAGGTRHFLNPSNTGIAVTLLLFPWVGIAPPYQFTEGVAGAWDWVVPAAIVVSGTALNSLITRKVPLILGWLGAFAAQALLRSLAFGTPLAAALVPMTGLTFVLFTFYMVTDPGTTPAAPAAQALFGAGVAVAYGLLMMAHVVFGLFFALFLVCSLRGIALYASAAARWYSARTRAAVPAPSPRPLARGV